MTKLKLDNGAAALLERLHGAGYRAYAVGGCVRDSLLGLAPHDWDLCTSARPEQVIALFGGSRCIPTGLQHGTVTVKWGGALYETTTFRTEGTYSDGRHPDTVTFVPEVEADLARRDFTINAMAYSAEEGLIDPFGGQADLAAGIVRAVGEPERRFEEDALRILRLYRFAARFGFSVEPATGGAAQALAGHLNCVSAERIQEELLKLLAAPQPGRDLEPAVLAVVLPELQPIAQPERFAGLCRVIDRLPPGAENVPTRLAALLAPLDEGQVRQVLRRLKCSNALTDEVEALEGESVLLPRSQDRWAGSSSEDRPLGWDPVAAGNRAGDGMACNSDDCGQWPKQGGAVGAAASRVQGPDKGRSDRWEPQPDFVSPAPALSLQAKRLLGRYELPTVKRLTALCTAQCPAQAEAFAALQAEAERLTAENACCRVSQLAVNGRDLMAVGIPAGPGLRRMLAALLEAVITDRIPNEKAALLDAAARFSAS